MDIKSIIIIFISMAFMIAYLAWTNHRDLQAHEMYDNCSYLIDINDNYQVVCE